MRVCVLLILMSLNLFAQNETYQFTYQFDQKYLHTTDKKKNEMNDAVTYEMNKSYDINVFSNRDESFIQLVDVVNNSQNNLFLNIKPEPNWLLMNFTKEESFEKASNVNQKFNFLKDKIQTKELAFTGRIKNILGIEAKEFVFKNEEFEYSYWLGDFKDYTVSPLYDQFSNQILLEASIKSLKMLKDGGKREINYSLKSMKKQNFRFTKLYPKKYITKEMFLENSREE